MKKKMGCLDREGISSKSISFDESPPSQHLICEQEKQDNNNTFLLRQHLYF